MHLDIDVVFTVTLPSQLQLLFGNLQDELGGVLFMGLEVKVISLKVSFVFVFSGVVHVMLSILLS